MAKELYTPVPRQVYEMLDGIKNGSIGLPDLQRPFVWKDNKVRDLLDSMMKGYPIGYVMTWDSPQDYENTRTIGEAEKTHKRPKELVIDGQQRLTSLLGALYGEQVIDNKYKPHRIRISFNPITKIFEVWSAAYERDPRWIEDISAIVKADEAHSTPKFRRAFIKNLNASRTKNGEPELSEDDEVTIEDNLNAVLDLRKFLLPTLQISETAEEEDVADIFKRVNSGGQNLNENNFIETLIAVYDNEVHAIINKFCADSGIPAQHTSYNNIIELQSSHLIRMAVGLGFHRARLRYAYKLLRGKDLATGETSVDIRNQNLTIFKEALSHVTNLNNWHSFLNLYAKAGYLSKNMIASSNAVVFCYIIYLLGKIEYGVTPLVLSKLLSRWIFMSTVTSAYTSGYEANVERMFADLREINNAEDFVSYFNQIMDNNMTDDFFNVKLIDDLSSSAAVSPAWYAYLASVNVLGGKIWLSTTPQTYFYTVGSSGTKSSIDKHHIFPKEYLNKIGISDDRYRNQIANFTLLDYQTNIDISDNPPIEYISKFRDKIGEDAFKKSCEENAIPEDIESLDYPTFLKKRRIAMAKMIRKAYMKLTE